MALLVAVVVPSEAVAEADSALLACLDGVPLGGVLGRCFPIFASPLGAEFCGGVEGLDLL